MSTEPARSGFFTRIDRLLLLLVTLCAGTSVVLLRVLWVQQITNEVDSNDWLVQLISLGLGLAGCLVVSAIDYHKLAKFWFLYAPVALGLVALTFTSLGYGREGADDRNWIDLGFIQIQPSEILKLVFLLTFAYHISKVTDKLNQPFQLFLLLIHAAIPMGIVAVQGDYGTAIIFASMTVFMLFAAGLSFWYLLGGTALMPLVIWFVWTYVFGDVHRGRIKVLLHPGTDPQGLEYQQNLGLKAIRSGKLFGLGLNGGDYVSVPEMHNDFIFSFIGEAFGFVGAIVVIVILAAICLRIFRDSRAAKDAMGRSICMGVFAIMFTHDLMNLGMVLKVMPVIGIPLPFFSAGGTAMLSMYLCIGLVISAYTHNQKKYRVFYDAEAGK
ncbi:MAG: FtsW/RodA/SpoVE family cell cycle protein [Oscillospiraceae bacterium]|nr:FtsW/RodA/SpoVE family cell cycle protein [Oscillospiraceae bacterium]MCR4759188.1 FtsW/RodA/SpoVE family cell cycle protein [Oscillospiraceae bacterium]